MTHDTLVHAFGICLLYALLMLAQDTVWSVSTKAIASNKTLLGASFNAIGDGLGKAAGIVTIALVAHNLTFSVEVAQVAGDMIGAFTGVVAGSHVSLALDRLITGYHRNPIANPTKAISVVTKVVAPK